MLINPFVLTADRHRDRYQYQRAVTEELKNPECQAYAQKPLPELTEPKYNDSEGREGCYHLYNHRHYNNQTKIPYTLEDLKTDSFRTMWGEILALSGIGIVVAGVLSALVYFFGTVVAWVTAGFRKTPQ